MANVRKLQYISNQYLLNIPAHLVKYAEWQKGDYLDVIPRGKDALEIRKVGQKDAPRAEVILANLENEASGLSLFINAAGANIDSATYSWYLARFSHVAAKARKLRQKINTQAQHEIHTAMKV